MTKDLINIIPLTFPEPVILHELAGVDKVYEIKEANSIASFLLATKWFQTC